MRMGANSQKLTRNQIIEFFQKEGRIRFDELGHGKADYVTDFDESAFARFLALAGISPSINRETMLHNLDKKNFKSNLVENIDNAMLFIQRHTKVEYKIEHLRREEIPDYPEVALREAVVNAVCHRDYFDKRANVLIEVFADRVEISNPGGLPSGLKPEDFGTRSVTRNPLIASLLHRIDYIEKIGTGISRIRQAVAEHQGTEVDIRFNDFFTVIFRAKTTPPAGGQIGGQIELTERQREVLELIRITPTLSRKSLAETLNINQSAVDKHLEALKKKGVLQRVGGSRGHWQVLEGGHE